VESPAGELLDEVARVLWNAALVGSRVIGLVVGERSRSSVAVCVWWSCSRPNWLVVNLARGPASWYLPGSRFLLSPAPPGMLPVPVRRHLLKRDSSSSVLRRLAGAPATRNSDRLLCRAAFADLAHVRIYFESGMQKLESDPGRRNSTPTLGPVLSEWSAAHMDRRV